jgi:hypothetical protein
LAAHYIGNPEISLEKTTAIIKADFFKDLPDFEKERLKKNLDFYKKAADEKNRQIKEAQKAQQSAIYSGKK